MQASIHDRRRAPRSLPRLMVRCSVAVVACAALFVTAATAVAAERLRVAGLTVPDTPAHEYWLRFSEALETESGGELEPTLYILGQIGSDEQIFASLRRARVDIAMAGHFSISTAVPEIGVISAPYLFESAEEAAWVVEQEIAPYLEERLAEKGLVLLQALPMGWMNIYAKQPLLAPGDLDGYRTRGPTDIPSSVFLRALSADLIQLPSSEVVPSLQTGLIDGGTTVTLHYVWGGIASEATHLTLTEHAFLLNATMANARWWKRLSEEERETIRASLPSRDWFLDALAETEDAELRRLAHAGENAVHRLEPTTLAAWRQAGEAVQAEVVDEIGGRADELYRRVLRGKASFRAEGDKR